MTRKAKTKPKASKRATTIRPELWRKGPLWSDISPELRTAWAGELPQNKEHVIVQFKEPLTKNRQLTAYEATHFEGYDSDFTANTQNSEGTSVFYVLQTEARFDTSVSVNSNGELEGILLSEPRGLTVNAAALKSIPQNNKQTSRYISRSSEMS